MLPSSGLLAFAAALGFVQAVIPPTNCGFYTPVPSPPKRLHCGQKGTLQKKDIIATSHTSASTCQTQCQTDATCVSFGFNSQSGLCQRFGRTLDQQGFRQSKTPVTFYNRRCFDCATIGPFALLALESNTTADNMTATTGDSSVGQGFIAFDDLAPDDVIPQMYTFDPSTGFLYNGTAGDQVYAYYPSSGSPTFLTSADTSTVTSSSAANVSCALTAPPAPRYLTCAAGTFDLMYVLGGPGNFENRAWYLALLESPSTQDGIAGGPVTLQAVFQ